jgi:hypothetical protein
MLVTASTRNKLAGRRVVAASQLPQADHSRDALDQREDFGCQCVANRLVGGLQGLLWSFVFIGASVRCAGLFRRLCGSWTVDKFR